MKNRTFICSRCGNAHPFDTRILVDGESICADCASDYTVLCDCCNTRIWEEDAVRDEHTLLCERCYERNYTRCTECDRIIPNNEVYLDDDNDAYCEDCWNEISPKKSIHEYSYKPVPIFYGMGPRYLGVELEIDGAGQDDYAARHILGAANASAEHLYIKTDGSLDNGMELVTYPMTLDYHMNYMPWNAILDEARSLGYKSHQTSTCGLHVHISRGTFGDTTIEQECAIARLLYFVEKFWTELLRFSRRTESQINRWAARYGMKLSPKEMMDCAKYSYSGRYMAVNLMNHATVEIRIFRGTLKLNTLLATLQMVNAICDVAVFASDEELQRLSWHDFLDEITEPELIQYLKERNLYKNEPVITEEDD